MTDQELKQEIKHQRLIGEFTGTLQGILWWDIPQQLREKLKQKIAALEKQDQPPKFQADKIG